MTKLLTASQPAREPASAAKSGAELLHYKSSRWHSLRSNGRRRRELGARSVATVTFLAEKYKVPSAINSHQRQKKVNFVHLFSDKTKKCCGSLYLYGSKYHYKRSTYSSRKSFAFLK